MKKRITALIAAIVMLLSLASCAKYSSLSVNGTKISKGIYNYFSDKIISDNPDADSAEQTALIKSAISEYVAVNSEFANRGLTLNSTQKSALSQSVNSLWRLFSSHYNDIGVSKQDLYTVKLNDAYRDSLFTNYYSPDGDSPVTDEELKTYFNENFVAFRAATGYLTTVDSDGKTVTLSDDSRQSVIDSFAALAQDINDEMASLDSADAYSDNVTLTSETVVIDKSSTKYPEGFFENVTAIENNKAASFVIGDYVFAVQRTDISSEDFDLFATYKSDALKSMKGEEFDKIVSDWSLAYPAQ